MCHAGYYSATLVIMTSSWHLEGPFEVGTFDFMGNGAMLAAPFTVSWSSKVPYHLGG
jgi:hypothetical protein